MNAFLKVQSGHFQMPHYAKLSVMLLIVANFVNPLFYLERLEASRFSYISGQCGYEFRGVRKDIYLGIH